MGIKLEYLEDLRFRAYSDENNGYSILLDTSKESGGSGEGMRPMDLILVSLAGCSSMDIISILKKKRQNVVDYNVSVTGEKADTHPRVFTKITIIYTIRGKNIEEQAVKRAIELSKDKYCSVWAMLKGAIDIKWSYRIENC
ncbi:OsmC family protein [Candidatus Acidulodesulfobacterium sp. H_13]|uniref:OsmC family protein n=1 Tax=Candidatus Acidulodesulfobacterium sp. H_13 TaxID=3395470 RepID=UPI003AF86E2C